MVSLLAGAGLRAIAVEVAGERPVLLKAMVILVATLWERLVKLKTPLSAVNTVVPCKAPLPALRVAVTVVDLWAAIRLPTWSSMGVPGWGARAAPAVAAPAGWVKMVSLLAGAGTTVTLAEFVPPPRLGLLKWIVMV